MNASEYSRPPLTPVPSPQPRIRHHQRKRNHSLVLAIETSTKLVISTLFLVGTTVALFRLIPYQQSQSEKLEDLKEEVEVARGRVAHLREDFTQYFDPAQTGVLMRDYSNRLAPNQRRIIFINNFTLSAKGSVNRNQ